jgi:hypothetical protein
VPTGFDLQMPVLTSDIERALDEIISNEEGIRFQRIAVVLAKQKWPELFASEAKKDLGTDAHAPALLAQDGRGKALACSLTARLEKVKSDVGRIHEKVPDVTILLFATPRRVTRETAQKWAEAIRGRYDIDLFIISREDIVTDLMMPSNASICRNLLGISVAIEPTLEELIEKTRAACSEIATSWLASSRLAGKPLIALQGVELDQEGRATRELLDLASLQATLLQSRRLVIEAPAGSGKTTTLIQLAERHAKEGELAFFIDLPAWIASRVNVLEFMARMPPYMSRGLDAHDLAKLCGNIHCSFLLNGWNEISDSYSEESVRALRELERNFPTAGIVVATRAHHIRPPLPGSFRVRLLPLTRDQRAEYLRQALANRAAELGGKLEGDPVLDELTRTPLILAEVTTLFQLGRPIPKTRMRVLGAVIRKIEESDEHRAYLQRAPLAGSTSEYLGELAVEMTVGGDVTTAEGPARRAVHSVSARLNTEGQIATLPEPATVLSTLCAHHLLERVDYPSVVFKFQHQQFQEFYAAVVLERELWSLAGKDDQDEERRFAAEYANKPVWEEPLRMLAEEISEASVQQSDAAQAITAGRRLIELALRIDPVFAAELSRLCGTVVWREVRSLFSERLRLWYENPDAHHRECALAGMIASGSEEFRDILLPLLTNDDQQVRLRTYRAWGEFHLSSIGPDWDHVVKQWKEEHRTEFISEVVRKRQMAYIAEELALEDVSVGVRTAAVQALQWVGAVERLSRVLTAFDDEAFEQILRNGIVDTVPAALKARAFAAYERLIEKTADPLARLGILFATAQMGEHDVSEGMKETLTQLPPGMASDSAQFLLKSALELVRKSDPQWVSCWLVDRIVDGSLWPDPWTPMISCISKSRQRDLLEQIGGRELDPPQMNRILPVFGAADADLCADLFSRICNCQTELSNTPTESRRVCSAMLWQLKNAFWKLPPNLAVCGLLARLSNELNPIEYRVAIDLFGSAGFEGPDLRTELDNDSRQALRKYLNQGLSFLLAQEDFNGELKAHFAVALARIGKPEDMADLYRLIRADIERIRRGRPARLRGEHGPLADGALMQWSTWYLRALVYLDSQAAEATLLELLGEPEYERDAAAALVQSARTQNTATERSFGFKAPDYRVVWAARNGQRANDFDEQRRRRYAIAIEQRISAIMEERSKSNQPDSFNDRLKTMATGLAVLDGHRSAGLVMDIMALPGRWDGWTRAAGLEALLFAGAQLTSQEALAALNPTIEHIVTDRSYDQQQHYLLRRCLCLLPFLDDPSIGIARIKQVLAVTPLYGHELGEVMTALGWSRCDAACDLLLDLARASETALRGAAREWIDALATLDTTESKRVLLSFADPEIGDFGVQYHFEHHELESLAAHIAQIAGAESAVRERLYLLCSHDLSTDRRLLLARIMAQFGTEHALTVGLSLMSDHANPSIPFDLRRSLESAFVERRPYDKTAHTYTLEPQNAKQIRRRLFQMIINDNPRKHAAWSLLGQIELWRLEYGRPANEPRHPALDSGFPWPPLESFAQLT